MSGGDWNDNPPRGAPMVDVPWLGPFYPPDAAAKGKTPSPPSPVFVAVKRTLGHLGAWVWDPEGYDDKFSNALAHGGGNGPGVEAVQRWAGTIDPCSGWIGLSTWNFLRSVLIQQGKPHGGEHAFDEYSCELVREAAAAAERPPEPPPEPQVSPRQAALDHLQRRLGYTEDPPSSNCDYRPDGIRVSQDETADGTWLRYQPWCGCWCFYALQTAGVAGIDSHLASVPQIHSYAAQAAKCYRGWTTDWSRARAGDLVVMGNDQHVEMVRATPTSYSTLTYGGNTSPGTSGSQSNGGGAYARTRYPSEVYGYALVRYPGE